MNYYSNTNMAMLPTPSSRNNDDSGLKKQRSSALEVNDSLLGMAASLFDPRNFSSNLFPEPNAPQARPEDITSQVLAELTADIFDDTPPTDDIFDDDTNNVIDSSCFEPVPLTQTQEEQNRFALLEQTLDQVLREENGYLSLGADDITTTTVATPTTTPVVVSPEPKNNNNKRQIAVSPDAPAPVNKKQKLVQVPTPVLSANNNVNNSEEDDLGRRFRPYQAEAWSEKFDELVAFKQQNSHCCVPHTFQENPSLARWVKRQRYQYKLKNENKPSTMTDERIVSLENIGFVSTSLIRPAHLKFEIRNLTSIMIATSKTDLG